ncbi:MAG: tetratricopeptide repeat protein [Isosphaeraceae bacterium]|jgi:hypothetical protein
MPCKLSMGIAPRCAVALLCVPLRHTGYTDPALRQRKLQRDCKILDAELAERSNDPFVLFNLGSIAVERQDWPTALGYLQRSLSRSAPTNSIVRKLFALIARCHQMLGDLPAALNACSGGLAARPPTTPSCISARRSSTARLASLPRPKPVGGGS